MITESVITNKLIIKLSFVNVKALVSKIFEGIAGKMIFLVIKKLKSKGIEKDIATLISSVFSFSCLIVPTSAEIPTISKV